ncbi:MAG: hypothetical protein NTV89_18485, partial [Proteobacteria bacterium]|nr:hypothetical protein [Pseudomonadota bacterium]
MPVSRPLFVLIAILLMTVHAFLMNGHQHVYQYLTVGNYVTPILAKTDPSLFKNSLYVQAVNHSNVRLTFFYDLFPFIVRYFDLEDFSIIVEIISLGFILAGLFRITRVLGGSAFAGLVAMLLYTAETNNWILGKPASYVNFFHHGLPYAYPLIIWSMVFFFQQRYTIAFLLAGISWSFHPMCTVFLLAAYGMYWLFNWKAFKPRTLLFCFLAFIIPAMPILVKALNNIDTSQLPDAAWMKVVIWTAWYTCFPSAWLLSWLVQASLFFLLFLLSLRCLPVGRQKTGIKIFTLTFALMCLAGTVFADFYPIPFIIKLSLWRSTLIFLFLALPCIACALVAIFNHTVSRRFLVIVTTVLLTGYLKTFSIMYLPLLLVFLLYAQYEDALEERYPFMRNKFGLLLFTALAILLVFISCQTEFSRNTLYLPGFFILTIIFLWVVKMSEASPRVTGIVRQPWAVVFTFIILFDGAVLYSSGGPAIYYHGRIRGKVDPWADIQRVAQNVSNKDDLFIVPPSLNDFGIYSHRASLGDWAEGSHALYLGSVFAAEWLARMNAIGWTRLHYPDGAEGYDKLSTAQAIRAAKKYRAKFIITRKPHTLHLNKIYENKIFNLYKVS